MDIIVFAGGGGDTPTFGINSLWKFNEFEFCRGRWGGGGGGPDPQLPSISEQDNVYRDL